MRQMTAVVDDNIDARNGATKTIPELPVSLIANKHFGLLVGVFLARGLNVDAVKPALRAEIRLPHIQAAAAEDAYFKHVHLSPDKFAEMPMINVEVVRPFPNASASSPGIKELTKRIGRFSRRRRP